ncbi:hypothetical protein CK516_29040 [Nostoc sp. 'Peltigera malacea cyanobiont' DB3992]|nr:hypothetical protein CK516_29040 [Nostoc sp. 'Peltigera malacea cyanobiont' DB3992]
MVFLKNSLDCSDYPIKSYSASKCVSGIAQNPDVEMQFLASLRSKIFIKKPCNNRIFNRGYKKLKKFIVKAGVFERY